MVNKQIAKKGNCELFTLENTKNSGLVNLFEGHIINIVKGELMVKVTVCSGENHITSIMPKEKFFTFGKAIGDDVTVAVNSFNVSLVH